MIVDETSKDYIDLLILNGDYEVANGNRNEGSSLYGRALQVSTGSDPDVSEMRARAFFHRGVNNEALVRKREAQSDYQAAEQIWNSLQDDAFAAEAGWKKICLSGSLSPTSVTVLGRETEDVKVRVEAARIYVEALKQSASSGARRSEPGAAYWRAVIRQAAENLALRDSRSETEW